MDRHRAAVEQSVRLTQSSQSDRHRAVWDNEIRDGEEYSEERGGGKKEGGGGRSEEGGVREVGRRDTYV